MMAVVIALDAALRAIDGLFDAVSVGTRSARQLVRATHAFYKAVWRLRSVTFEDMFGPAEESLP